MFYYILKIKTNKIADTVVCLVFTDIDSFLLKLKYSYQDNQHSPISLVPLWKRSRPFLQSGKYSKILSLDNLKFRFLLSLTGIEKYPVPCC